MSSTSTWLVPLITGLGGAAAGATGPLLLQRLKGKTDASVRTEDQKREILNAIATARDHALAWQTEIDRVFDDLEMGICRDLENFDDRTNELLANVRKAVFLLAQEGFPVNGEWSGESPVSQIHDLTRVIRKVIASERQASPSLRASVQRNQDNQYLIARVHKVRELLNDELLGRSAELLNTEVKYLTIANAMISRPD